MRNTARLLLLILMSLPITFSAHLASGQDGQDLPLGEMTASQLLADDGATFRFVAQSAGLLTIMVHAEEVDLFIEVSDAIGQLVEEGRADIDLFGNTGMEQLAAALRRPGEYQIRVGSFMQEQGDFSIGATWLPVAAVEVPPAPDGSPDNASTLVAGTPIDGTLDASVGDSADWYVVEATSDVVLTVITEGEDDVFLEVYSGGDFTTFTDRSDQDLQGSAGNESVTVRLRAGEKAYFKVLPFSGLAQYSIRAGTM